MLFEERDLKRMAKLLLYRDDHWMDVEIRNWDNYYLIADAIQQSSSKELVHPELLLALMTEMWARMWVDVWIKEDREKGEREGRPPDTAALKREKSHRAISTVMVDVLEMLEPELGRWWPDLAFSLAYVRAAIEAIRWEDCPRQ